MLKTIHYAQLFPREANVGVLRKNNATEMWQLCNSTIVTSVEYNDGKYSSRDLTLYVLPLLFRLI
jgi:hypothetical protein